MYRARVVLLYSNLVLFDRSRGLDTGASRIPRKNLLRELDDGSTSQLDVFRGLVGIRICCRRHVRL